MERTISVSGSGHASVPGEGEVVVGLSVDFAIA